MKLVMTALAAAAAGAIGLGALTLPAGAGAEPALPEVSAEELVAAVLTAKAPAFAGTVEVDNALGLPALPGLSERPNPLTQPVSTLRVWSDGQGRGRLALPSRGGEQVLVEDGSTLWRYDSASRTATALPHGTRQAHPRAPVTDPAQAARELVGAVRESSAVTVDGTTEVAGRPVYELVLTPKPTERTLLREVRVAVDSATRVPLQLTVLADGSSDPALQIGFTKLAVEPQDPALFRFIPPEGVTVERPEPSRVAPGHPKLPRIPHGQHHEGAQGMVRTVGDGWDTVVLGQLPTALPRQHPQGQTERGQTRRGQTDPLALIQQVGRPTSGSWGHGWVVQTAVGTVLVTSDGRVAAGAVPQQVLAEALTR
ncbi:MAG TPA: outer membrane lipoprotein carrier protein LolA [Pseudonocardiaceae bacterium]|jgi:outer membrane lipoprotein-sorting protein|nr:outer membrane lipoprotein carrier protein LolA [Pseudonocardiaceae bacterium]